MSLKIVCLGNHAPRAYKNNPPPPDGLPLAALKVFATTICGLDISGLKKTGDVVNDRDGKPLYKVTEAHEDAFIRELIQQPVEIPWFGGKCRTKIKLSKESNLAQSLSEIGRIWRINSHVAPGWIAGDGVSREFLKMLGVELGMAATEDEVEPLIRDYEEDGK